MSSSRGISIEIVTTFDEELFDALQHLLPQLSATARIPSREHLREVIDARGTFLLIARNARRIIGTLTLVVFQLPTGVRARIEDLVVDADARGAGAGEQLSRMAFQLAADHRADAVELTSASSREAANRLYRRLGFESRDTNVYRHALGRTTDGGPSPHSRERGRRGTT